MGFSISSPDLQALQSRIERVDVGKSVARAIDEVSRTSLTQLLQNAAQAAGASDGMVRDITTYKHQGNIYVGVQPSSAHHQEAVDLEYGTAVGAPAGWLRGTVARNKRDLEQSFSGALHRQFGLA